MHLTILIAVCCCLVPYIAAENVSPSSPEDPSGILDRNLVQPDNEESRGVTLNRQKRTLLLKKKLIGAGLLGFGLGVAKGYKAGYYTAPRVHHAYLSPPPSPSVKYIEYVEKPIYVERIVESPVSFLKPAHVQYKDPSAYGSW